MFFKKNWRISALLEGEKEAMVFARMEGLPDVNHEFDKYPVDATLTKKMTHREAVRKSKELGLAGIYNVIYKE